MTDFKNFYAKTLKNFPSSLNDFEAEMQRAYEAGAASQAGTLRDEFAGQAMRASWRHTVGATKPLSQNGPTKWPTQC